MTEPGKPTGRPSRAAQGLQAALVGVALLLAGIVVGAVPAAAQNGVGASTPVMINTVGAAASIGAGQRLGKAPPQPQIVVATAVAAETGGGRLASLRGMLADDSGSLSFGGDEATRVAGRIADHSLNEGHSIPGVADDALHDYVAGVMRDNPGYAATRGRTVWWDGDRGAIIIRQGSGGSVFTPDRGYQYFLDQLAE